MLCILCQKEILEGHVHKECMDKLHKEYVKKTPYNPVQMYKEPIDDDCFTK